MNIKDARETIEKFEDMEDKCCTCHLGNPSCSKCVDCPTEEDFDEAIKYVHEIAKNADNLLEELLESELGDYTFKWEIDKTDEDGDSFWFEVTYYMYDYQKADSILFRVDMDEEKIYVNKYEDKYEEIDVYEPSIKHLWMLVRWDEST